MPHLRTAWLTLLLAAAVCLPASLAQQPVKPAKPAEAPKLPPPPKADAAAENALRQAVERYGPDRTGWLKTTVWQQASLEGLTYQADGTYLAGPGNRVRLELKVRVGELTGESLVVSDGKTVWQSAKSGSGERVVQKFTLKQILDTLAAPGVPALAKDIFLQESAFTGVGALLKNLQQQLVFTEQRATKWQGRDVVAITGIWNPDITKGIAATDRWPFSMPRRCQVFLEPKTYWPMRIEWLGPTPPRGDDVVLMQIEFRDPLLLAAGEKPPADLEKLFVFTHGDEKAVDVTTPLREEQRRRAKELAVQKKGPAAGTGR
jgi:hypothetical protein